MNIYAILSVLSAIPFIIYLIYLYHKSKIDEYLVMCMVKKFTQGNFEIKCGDLSIHRNVEDLSLPIQKLIINENCREHFFNLIRERSEVGLGESYLYGDWYSDDIESLLTNMYLNSGNVKYTKAISAKNLDEIGQDKKNISYHYDVGNDFYKLFLTDPLMSYSCAIWNDKTTNLDEAQLNKANIIIRKLNPKWGQRILDIGCGWGKITKYIADKTNTHITGITISSKQAVQIMEMLNLASESDKNNRRNVDVMIMDYRHLYGLYDHIYSIGMFEHVRHENYDTFFQTIKKCLNPGGRFVLHTIISFDKGHHGQTVDSFVMKYIFPGGEIPLSEWIVNAVQRSGLRIIHVEFFGGQHYAKTLQEWRSRMMNNRKYIEEKYGIELLRRYDYYFASCYALFTTGNLGIGHYIITSKKTLNINSNSNFTY
jgi:cyclopropane-fatty-acyl-phospholipid synthase